jgi:hypothetical protein
MVKLTPWSQFHQCFMQALFVQNYGTKKFQTQNTSLEFWRQNFVKKCAYKTLMKLTPWSLDEYNNLEIKLILITLDINLDQTTLSKHLRNNVSISPTFYEQIFCTKMFCITFASFGIKKIGVKASVKCLQGEKNLTWDCQNRNNQFN